MTSTAAVTRTSEAAVFISSSLRRLREVSFAVCAIASLASPAAQAAQRIQAVIPPIVAGPAAAGPASATATDSPFPGVLVAKASAKKPETSQTETYRDLIEKAQNLSLQKDRLQASQILQRAIKSESKSSQAYKELTRSLDELMTTFYTERAQSTFTAAESKLQATPREALDGYNEALRLEDGNVTVLKAIARVHLTQNECDKADTAVKQAEALDPVAPEVQLLRLQVMDCNKASQALAEKLFPVDPNLQSVETYVHGFQIKDLLRRSEFKRAKAIAAQWESADADYPEVSYWKWMISKSEGKADRAAAQKYVQLCQNLSPRKRKSYNLDVDLCKGKETVDTFLKEPSHED